MFFKQLKVGEYGNFSYVLGCEKTGKGCVIDPGWRPDLILKETEKNNIEIVYILNTHYHHDHTNADLEIKEKTGAKIVLHKEDARYLENNLGVSPDIKAEDGQVFNVGDLEICLIHTPGHTPGSSCYLVEGKLFTGDTLFQIKCGRTDFRGGNTGQMFESMTKLRKMDDELLVYPGHDYGGPRFKTLGELKMTNPALAATDFDDLEKFDFLYS